MIKGNKIFFLLTILLLIGFAYKHDLGAVFYKYVDEKGVLHFVDDPARIPMEYRKDLQTYSEKYDQFSEEKKLDLIEKDQAEFNRNQEEQTAEQDYLEIQETSENKSEELADQSQDSESLETQVIIRFWQRYVMDKIFDSSDGWECQNMLTVCLLMAQSAQTRQESRGVHYRRDFSEIDDKHFKKHIEISRQF